MQYAFRCTESQYSVMKKHLFPGDGNEAIAFVLCGRRKGKDRHVLVAQEVALIPHEQCTRSPLYVDWNTDFVDPLITKAYGNGLAILKIHSHPGGLRRFSSTDDDSDQSIFASVASLMGDDLPHGSMVMLPNGSIFGRILQDGVISEPIDSIMVVGDDIKIWRSGLIGRPLEGFTRRHAQAFGRGTSELLRSCSAAVVGCSGTGSLVVELLARLGIGRLILVDPDVVEEKNLNRIVNSGKEDAYLGKPKVNVLASSIARMGLGTEVVPIYKNLASRDAVQAVAECDFAFGCMDGAEGRHLLNRLATYYLLPYFDVGVRLDADGKGSIDGIWGSVHYLQPGLSSLLSREVYTLADVEAEGMRRTNPDLFAERRKAGYIKGVDEDRPAVISVNALFSSLCVNEFLGRLHAYRNNPNSRYAEVAVNLGEMQFLTEEEGSICSVFRKHVGKGDIEPLLEMPSLS